MSIRSLKSFAAAGLIAVAALASSVAHGAIVLGSRVQIIGSVYVDPANPHRMVFQTVSGPQDPTTNTVLIGSSGNLLSYAGYNLPNVSWHHLATIQSLPAVPPALVSPIAAFLSLPPVTTGSGEPGPAVAASTFDLMSWTTTLGPAGSTLSGLGRGMIHWASGSIEGEFRLSIPFFDQPPPGNIYAFAATLAAIPVPGAVLLFGSGLLFLTLVGRFRRV